MTELKLPIDPGHHIPIKVTLTARRDECPTCGERTIRLADREAIQCVFCRQDWPCDRLEAEYPGLRALAQERGV